MARPSSRVRSHLQPLHPSLRFRRLLAAGIAMGTGAYLAAYWRTPARTDFLNLYSAATAAVTGHIASIYDVAAFTRLQYTILPLQGTASAIGPGPGNSYYVFLYLPVHALLLAPLALLPYAASRLLYGLASLVCLAGTIHLGHRLSGTDWGDTALVVLLCGFTINTLALGQLSVFLLFRRDPPHAAAPCRPARFHYRRDHGHLYGQAAAAAAAGGRLARHPQLALTGGNGLHRRSCRSRIPTWSALPRSLTLCVPTPGTSPRLSAFWTRSASTVRPMGCWRKCSPRSSPVGQPED